MTWGCDAAMIQGQQQKHRCPRPESGGQLMVPHVDTVCQFGMIHHQYLQTEASRGHLTAHVAATNTSMGLMARVRRVVGVSLAALGSRILDPRHIAFRRGLATTRPEGALLI